MCTRRTTIIASLVAAFALAATVSLAGAVTPAQAYDVRNTEEGPNFHTSHAFPPKFPNFRPCADGHVTLPRGTYRHGAFMVSQARRADPDLEYAVRYLKVRKPTTYYWQACRSWNEDPNPDDSFDRGAYQVRSTLYRPGRGKPLHTAAMTFQNEVGGRRFLYGNGKYEWGGRIERACPGCTFP